MWGWGVGGGVVRTVQRTFEMAHLAATSCTPPRRCHHLHTSHEMKTDGESRRRRRRCSVKVTPSSKTPRDLFIRPLVLRNINSSPRQTGSLRSHIVVTLDQSLRLVFGPTSHLMVGNVVVVVGGVVARQSAAAANQVAVFVVVIVSKSPVHVHALVFVYRLVAKISVAVNRHQDIVKAREPRDSGETRSVHITDNRKTTEQNQRRASFFK